MTTPSAIIIATIYTFFKNALNGWVKLNDATINGDGFKVEFYRLFERTIDRNCDALNGWHSIKTTKFLCELTIGDTTKSLVVNTEKDADKLFEIFSKIEKQDFEEEGIMEASEVASTTFDTLKNWMN